VRSPDQLHGNGLQSYGSRRIVLAFDPEQDDPDLLRTVVQLLRLSALSAAARQDGGEIQIAQEKVAEALALLSKIDGIKTTAGQIKKSATKTDAESDSWRPTWLGCSRRRSRRWPARRLSVPRAKPPDVSTREGDRLRRRRT